MMRQLVWLFAVATLIGASHAGPTLRLKQSLRRLKQPKVACKAKGTMLFFGETPSDEKLARWFYEAKEPNHNSAGMTNPALHYSVDETCGVQQVSLNGGSTKRESSWWPALPSPAKGNWRVLRFTRRVGRGLECYECVRDCCLDWKFSSSSDGGKHGIRAVKAPARRMIPRQIHSGTGYDIVRNELAVEDKPCSTTETCLQIGPGRKFATYAEAKLLRFLPKLQVYNPGSIVYDILDQRGPGTTFSSTAFGTLRGHWLQGEERVSVAIRDHSEAVDVEIVSYSRPSPGIGRMVWPFISAMQNRFFKSQLRSIEAEAEKAPQRTSVRPQQVDPAQIMPSEL